MVACAVTLAGVTALFLADPVLRHFRYPVGWDAPYYVWRTAAVPLDGLARLGAVRSGSPLLLAVLMRATGQNPFTILTVVPPVLAAVVGLGSAALARAGLAIRPVWVPVVGLMAWVGFGRVGIVNGHYDQLLNAALVVSGFAAAVALAGAGRGAIAAGLLLAAAGLAEWPFWAFGAAVLLTSLALFAAPSIKVRRAGQPAPLGPVGPLIAAVGASGLFTGLLFLAPPPGGGLGPALSTPGLRRLLRRRFLTRIRDPLRYLALPFAIGGGVAAARAPAPPATPTGRRLFVCLMAAWVGVTVVAGVAQLAGIPVAGARLTSYLFAVTILAAVGLWAGARAIASRIPNTAGRILVGALVVSVVGGFAAIEWATGRARVPYFEEQGVQQAAVAGAYLDRVAANRPVVFLVANPRGDIGTGERWWRVVQAALPPSVVARADRFEGPPSAYQPRGTSVAVVLARFNKLGYQQAVRAGVGAAVAPGVLVLGASPGPGATADRVAAPQADLRVRTLLWLLPALALLLIVSGSGWSAALLPPDPVLRIALAPALGAAALSILALGWERVGLGFGQGEALVVVALAVASGWIAAAVRLRRPGPAPP
jgi:hypothetical protein